MLPEIKTILYPTGLGSGAPFVFRYALSLARKYQARIAIVYGMEPLRPAGQAVAATYLSEEKLRTSQQAARERIREEIRANILKLFEEALAEDPEALSRMVDISVVEAAPHEAIRHAAKAFEADLIVMGTHRHTVVKGTLLGNTALKVLHDATIPVVMVRIPDGYQDHDR